MPLQVKASQLLFFVPTDESLSGATVCDEVRQTR